MVDTLLYFAGYKLDAFVSQKVHRTLNTNSIFSGRKAVSAYEIEAYCPPTT